MVSKEKPQESTPELLEIFTSDGVTGRTEGAKADCRCSGRAFKLHKVGDPFCHFPETYKPPSDKSATECGVPSLRDSGSLNLTSSPVTFDEDLLMSCINRAIAKTPGDFVTMLDNGSVSQVQARRINNELRLMGYCISEEPF